MHQFSSQVGRAGRWSRVALTILVVGAAVAWGGGRAGASTTTAGGYRLLGGDGGVFSFGAAFAGSAASDPTRCPADSVDRQMPDGTCWSMAATPDGGGYWILNASSGQIWDYGTAPDEGSPAATFDSVPREFVPNFIGIASTPDGRGYWVLAVGLSGMGSVLPFGDARFYGDETTGSGPAGHAGTPVALVPTRSGSGYWIVDSDGGVFSFGDAVFRGSLGGTSLDSPVVGAARTNDGGGYWLVAGDGGVFSFGDAGFSGSISGIRLAAPVVGMAADPGGAGYWLAGRDGGVFAFGGAPFLGSLAGISLVRPVFAVTAGRSQG